MYRAVRHTFFPLLVLVAPDIVVVVLVVVVRLVRPLALRHRVKLKKLRGFALNVVVSVWPFVPLVVVGLRPNQFLRQHRRQVGIVRVVVAPPPPRPLRLFGKKRVKRLVAQFVPFRVAPRPRYLFAMRYRVERFKHFDGQYVLVAPPLRFRVVQPFRQVDKRFARNRQPLRPLRGQVRQVVVSLFVRLTARKHSGHVPNPLPLFPPLVAPFPLA